MSHIIGIDLGTTNSLCGVFLAGEPRLIPNAVGSLLTPSVVGILDDGQLLVGEAARELRVTRPEACVSCFKRLMGSNEKVTLLGRSFSAPELSSLVLRSLKGDAETFLREEVTEAVITVPAYFNDNQRKATKIAGELAGLKVRRILNEPTAAALTYGFHDRNAEKRLIVIDLGGGTFDVTLMEVFEGTLEIVATAGESCLGGEDFTNRMVAILLAKQGKQFEVAELQQPLQVARLRQLCEQAKRGLLDQEEVSIRLPDELGQLPEKARQATISRAAYATAVKPLLDRLAGPINKALRDGRTSAEQIDEVILVGGATRMVVLQDFVREYFQQEPHARFNPDEVVGLGAAVQAALIADDRAVDDMVMTDVCPFTLGVETCRELGGQRREGYFTPIIHRNTTIPVSKEDVFSTVVHNQQVVKLSIYQGENRRVEHNLKIGELEVTGIPPGPAGQEIFIRFTYDLNGLLEVEAYVANSTNKFRTVLTQHSAHMSDEELREAVERMQQLKYYPREDMVNQRLLRFAERMVGEVSPYLREQVEAAVDYFEQALNGGDKQGVEHARAALIQVFASLGISVEEFDE